MPAHWMTEELARPMRLVTFTKLLLGTDYPFDAGPTDPTASLTEARLTEQPRTRILGANAARLFGTGG